MPTKSALNYSLFLLSRRDYFILEIKKKMKLKSYTSTEIDSTVKKLIELKYLDDDKVSAIFVEQLKKKGKGSNYIKLKIVEKAGPLFRDMDLSDLYSYDEEVENVLRQLIKIKTFKNKYDLIKKLINRGYSMESIRSALKLKGFDDE